ncbi:hypothetical protein D9756_006278 [Leucocoprinus leucothites]|uniref:DUF6534 domain-containing protein n=1 Tax=Leucocoprinus leucothites TaxID=201217 RepID=A0A8H5D598_9AGAR|nr:hypothetical protein D9756_006278 [Leucoagaricus leucothites]
MTDSFLISGLIEVMYLNNGKGDKKWLRATVHFMFLLDTIQSIMMMEDLFFWFVHNFDNYSMVASEFHLVTIDGLVLDALIMFIAQLVYCWRLKELGQWMILPAATAFLALVSCVSGIFNGIKMFVDPASTGKYTFLEEIWLLASAITDIIITSSMTYLLMKYQKEYRFMRKSMMTWLKHMALLTVETGAITATISIVLFIFEVTPSLTKIDNVTIALGSVIGKMYYFNTLVNTATTHRRSIHRYSNCFMVLLNQRIYYNKYAKANPTTVILGGASRIQDDGQNETTRPPLSMLQFNDIGSTVTSATTSEQGHTGAAKNGQELMSSVPNEIV